MPTRSYGNVNLQNIQILSEGLDNASIIGTGFNLSASGAGTIAFGGGYSTRAQRLVSAELDFNQFPSIPASATITNVRVRLNVDGNATGTNASTRTLQLQIYGGYPDDIFSIALVSNAANPAVLATLIDVNDATVNTKSELITNYGDLAISFLVGVGNDGIDHIGEPTSISLILANFTLDVTYDLENYSWYIQPTKKIVNGKTVRTIRNAVTQIIQVVDGDEPPEVLEGELPYEFYGTSEDYPSGVEYIWWQSVDFYEFYIYSPINPSWPGPSGSIWVPVGGVPTCTGCLTLTLDELDVLVADASGIYTMIKGKFTDTMYNRADEDTTETKIPNPFIKSGLLP